MAQVAEGVKAVDFELDDAYGKKLSLGSLKGSWVILYFYPKDNTPGCTLEALDFSSLKDDFKKLGAKILGVSKDSCKSHQSFIDKKGLTITLLSDPGHEVMEEYGVWGEKTFMGKTVLGAKRTTFIVDPNQVVAKRYDNVKAKGHAEKVLSDFRAMLG